MEAGASFEYGVKIMHPQNGVKEFVEKYVLKSSADGMNVFEVTGNPEGTFEREASEDSASGIFSMGGMFASEDPEPENDFGRDDVKYYRNMLCGGSQEIWMGDDRIALKVVNSQLWVACTYREIRTLLSYSAR